MSRDVSIDRTNCIICVLVEQSDCLWVSKGIGKVLVGSDSMAIPDGRVPRAVGINVTTESFVPLDELETLSAEDIRLRGLRAV